MRNKITITFTPCNPAPDGGYNLYYRLENTSGAYILAGNFTSSPIEFFVPGNDPVPSFYEGYIAAVVNGTECSPVNFGAEDLITGTIDVLTNPNRWAFTFNKPFPCNGQLYPLNYQGNDNNFYNSFCVVQAGATSGTDTASNPGVTHTISCVHNSTNPGSNLFEFTVNCSGTIYRVKMTMLAPVCP